jgi:predicted TIM-barrel fold metal-dependent hydrolase
MVVDFHAHAFPREVRENRERYFSGEPAFKLLYDSPKSRLVGAREILLAMDAEGVDKTVIFGFPWKAPDVCKRTNDYIMEAVARHPDRLIGLCCFDGDVKDADVELERCLDGGLSGAGELAFYTSGIDDRALEKLAPIMAVCRRRRCPVMVHTNEPVGHTYPGKTPNTLKQIYDMVRRFPDNDIVLAHWGGGLFLFNLLKKEVGAALTRVWFDTAASPFLYKADIYRLAGDLAGIDKVLFGTDFPLLKPKRYFSEMEESGLTRDEIEQVCGGNAAKLLGLDDA